MLNRSLFIGGKNGGNFRDRWRGMPCNILFELSWNCGLFFSLLPVSFSLLLTLALLEYVIVKCLFTWVNQPILQNYLQDGAGINNIVWWLSELCFPGLSGFSDRSLTSIQNTSEFILSRQINVSQKIFANAFLPGNYLTDFPSLWWLVNLSLVAITALWLGVASFIRFSKNLTPGD